jgi:hypothetical protein
MTAVVNIDFDAVNADWPKRTDDRRASLVRPAGAVYDLTDLRFNPKQPRDAHGRWGTGSGGRVCEPKTSAYDFDEADRATINRPYTLRRKDGTETTVDVSDSELDAHFGSVLDSASAEQTAVGSRWYDDAHAQAVRFGEEYGVSTEVAAGVIAALSPNRDWKGNVTVADKALAAHRSGQFDDLSDDDMAKAIEVGFGSDAIQAVRIMRTGDVAGNLTGLKRQSFVNNIMRPDAGYDVTVDGWVAGALKRMKGVPEDAALGWLGRQTIRGGKVVIGGAGYIRVADSIRRVAAQRNLTPAQAQAIYWVTVGGGHLGGTDKTMWGVQ